MNTKKILGSVALALGLLAANMAVAQAPAGAPAGSTALCNDGTYFKGSVKIGACTGHKGVKTWWGAATAKPAAKPAPAAATKPAAKTAPAPAAKPASTPAPVFLQDNGASARRRPRPGLAQHLEQRVSLPGNTVLRKDQGRLLHERS